MRPRRGKEVFLNLWKAKGVRQIKVHYSLVQLY